MERLIEEIKEATRVMKEENDAWENAQNKAQKETIHFYKDLVVKYEKKLMAKEETIRKLEQKLNKIKNLSKNKYFYLDENDVLFDSMEELKEAHIENYQGLDDGMTDWYPESEELSYREVVEKIIGGEL